MAASTGPSSSTASSTGGLMALLPQGWPRGHCFCSWHGGGAPACRGPGRGTRVLRGRQAIRGAPTVVLGGGGPHVPAGLERRPQHGPPEGRLRAVREVVPQHGEDGVV